MVQAGDFDQVGKYDIQAYIETVSWSGYGTKTYFYVRHPRSLGYEATAGCHICSVYSLCKAVPTSVGRATTKNKLGWIMDFPQLSYQSYESWEETFEDAVIRSPFEAGYELTRKRFTHVRKIWRIRAILSEEDKNILQQFEKDTDYGANAFDWLNPEDNLIYTVRFAERITYRPVSNRKFWDVTYTLVEV